MTAITSSFRLGHRPGLDGLRGMAILLVLADHGGWLNDGFGFLGVNTFFVLSGFLITSLLVLEWEQYGKISYSSFYLRRALRLLPALISMLIAFTVYELIAFSGQQLKDNLHEVLYALFYMMNWDKVFQLGQTLELAHTWSLSLEEQFYFCWPLLLAFFLRKTTRSSLLCWVALGAIISVTIRILLQVGDADAPFGSPDRLTNGLDTRADALLLGCFVGIAATSNLLAGLKKTARVSGVLSLLAGAGLVFLGTNRPDTARMADVGWLTESVLAAFIIAQLITCSGSLMHYVLENRVLVYIGKISYGLYIWHFPILRALEKHNLPWRNMSYCIPTLVVALGSFYLIERPFLRWKTKFQQVHD
jgi:peptidoglycan/LPS O-acetylase OafA/YrhL